MANPVPKPWAILLCRYRDDSNDPNQVRIRDLAAQWRAERDPTFIAANLNPTWDMDNRTILDLYQTFFTITGIFTFNAVRFWDEMSHGKIYVGDSQVFPCVLSRTIAEGAAQAASPGGATYQNDTFKLAKEALSAQHGVDWKDFNAVAVSFQSPDFGAQGGWFDDGPGVFMDIRYVKNNGIQAWGQEMGHAFGLDHSRTDGEIDANGIGIDYTDPWDVMSTLRAFSATDNSYGMRGPGLNAWNMRSRKWLDETRIWKGPPNKDFSEVISLRPLHKKQLDGFLGAELPPVGNHSAYLVELRISDDWDAGIQNAKILVHRFEGQREQFLGTHSYLMTGSNGQKALATGDVFQSGAAPFSRLKVLQIDVMKMEARVELCYSSNPIVKPSVEIEPRGQFLSHQKCHPQNVEGEFFAFTFQLHGDCVPDYQVLWSVFADGYPFPFSPGTPDGIWVNLPHTHFGSLDVYLTIVFADGTTITDHHKQNIISREEAQRVEFLCSLVVDRKFPTPWWQWEAAEIREIVKSYNQKELETIAERTEHILQSVRQMINHAI